MDSLTVYSFESSNVRVVMIDGEPWFVVKDVLAAMGSKSRTNDVKALVEEDLGDGYVTVVPILDNIGRTQQTLVLSEPALTMFVSRSRTELGKAMNRWIHAEVLPQIRKTGSYVNTPQNYLEALKALVAKEEQRILLEEENRLLQEANEHLAEAVDELFDYSSIIRIAKFNNVSEKTFSWRKLKAASNVMGLEVKKVPCPRFEYKLLYSHDAWRYCYPEMRLPETTTLTIYPTSPI